MNTEELKQSFQDIPRHSVNELEDLLDKGLDKANSGLRRNMNVDFSIAIVIAALCVLSAFVLDLKYRWVVFLAMVVFGMMMWMHYLIKYKILLDDNPENVSLSAGIQKQLNRLNVYRMIYLVGIPVFAGILSSVYLFIYVKPATAELGLEILLAFVGTFLLVRVLWNKLYGKSVRRYRALRMISERLRD